MCTYRLSVAVLGGLFAYQGIAEAQVVTDGTTGEVRDLEGPDYDIDADLGTQSGSNLFHSFETFSIRTDESATFSGPGSIDNIISRVTGGEISAIDGLIASTIPGASLWLFNPTGVVFGPNASLDVSGSFHVSTADELRTADGGTFSAIDPESSGFSVAQPESFGFLGADPAGITIAGSQLEVGEGETLSIVGGDIDITGASLNSQGGDLNVLAASGPADANVETGALTGAAGGNISIDEGATLASVGDSGGTIRIEGGAFVIDGASNITSINDGTTDGDIGISINAESTDIAGQSNVITSAQDEGRGGDLNVETASLDVSGGSLVQSNTQADGDSGNLSIETGAMRVDGGSRVSSSTIAAGDGGNLDVDADEIAVTGESQIEINTQGDGNSGDMTLNADAVRVDDGSRVASAATGAGDGGDLNVDAGEIVITGESQFEINTQAGGKSGDMNLNADAIRVADNASVATVAIAEGDGGDVNITGGRVTFKNGGSGQSRTDTDGKGGAFNIAADDIVIAGNSIGSNSGGAGDGGNINISGEDVTLRDGGFAITVAQDAGDGGDINVAADELLLSDGSILTNVREGSTGDGGDILITAGSTEVLSAGPDTGQSSFVGTGTFGLGDAGNIDIRSDALVLDGNNQLNGASIQSASDGEGLGGQIRVAIDGRLDIVRGGVITTQGRGTSSDIANIEVSAAEILIDGDGSFGDTLTGITLDVNSDAASTGAIVVEAEDLELRNGAVINSITNGVADAGDITITVGELSLIGGQDTASLANIASAAIPGATGDAGTVEIIADDIDMRGNSEISTSTSGDGDAGAVTIKVKNDLDMRGQAEITSDTEFLLEDERSPGNAGTIVIEASDLVVADDALIASVTSGSGDAGSVDITAGTALFAGSDADGLTGVTTQATRGSSGNAGDITLSIDKLTLRNTAQINSASFSEGDGGSVTVRSEEIVIDNRQTADSEALTGIVTSADPVTGEGGDAGSITIDADRLTLRGDGAEVVSSNESTGTAGEIDIQLTDSLILDNGADISTSSESGGGGGITIKAGNFITATGPSASITTTVADDTGNAGDILIETPVLALGDAKILAQADAGRGGDIQVTVDDLILSPDAEINAEAGDTGIDGTVAISTAEVDLTGGLVALDGQLLDVSALLRERCAAKRAEDSSSFTLGTGGSIPTDLDAPRLSLRRAPTKEASVVRHDQRTVLVLPCPKAAS